MLPWPAKLHRLYLAARFRLWQRRRLGQITWEVIGERYIVVLPDVLNPKVFLTGEFMALSLSSNLIPQGSSVLDMGTGTGIGAVFAAQWARRVVAVDVNPEAVRCAQINAMLNRVEDRVSARHGDLFDSVGDERFDVVLFNPPYFSGRPRNALEQALFSHDILDRFASSLPRHLEPDGYALVVWSDRADEMTYLRAFSGFRSTVVRRRQTPSELFTFRKVDMLR